MKKMDKIKLYDKTFKTYLTNDQIEADIDKVAERLNRDYAGRTEPVMLLCVMNGAMLFAAELLKRLNFPLHVISIKLRSYAGTGSTGDVQVVMGLTGDVTGRDVIIIEDIVDTGNTIVALRDILLEKGAASVKICTMLTKPEVYQQSLPLDYVGMEIENRFIVGYGLDYDELGRNLKDIYILE